jgi:hypothetical protein
MAPVESSTLEGPKMRPDFNTIFAELTDFLGIRWLWRIAIVRERLQGSQAVSPERGEPAREINANDTSSDSPFRLWNYTRRSGILAFVGREGSTNPGCKSHGKYTHATPPSRRPPVNRNNDAFQFAVNQEIIWRLSRGRITFATYDSDLATFRDWSWIVTVVD